MKQTLKSPPAKLLDDKELLGKIYRLAMRVAEGMLAVVSWPASSSRKAMLVSSSMVRSSWRVRSDCQVGQYGHNRRRI
jgi:hypothetical protein